MRAYLDQKCRHVVAAREYLVARYSQVSAVRPFLNWLYLSACNSVSAAARAAAEEAAAKGRAYSDVVRPYLDALYLGVSATAAAVAESEAAEAEAEAEAGARAAAAEEEEEEAARVAAMAEMEPTRREEEKAHVPPLLDARTIAFLAGTIHHPTPPHKPTPREPQATPHKPQATPHKPQLHQYPHPHLPTPHHASQLPTTTRYHAQGRWPSSPRLPGSSRPKSRTLVS